MTIQLKNLVPGASQLTNGVATYYTAPAGASARINNATLVNTDAAVHTASVWIVQPGGSVDDGNIIIKDAAIQPNETYNCPELVAKNIMPGGTIQAVADANSAVSFHVSGLEQT